VCGFDYHSYQVGWEWLWSFSKGTFIYHYRARSIWQILDFEQDIEEIKILSFISIK
jgi:hypothetical protein